MATTAIELPDDLRHFADERIKSGRYRRIVDVARDAFDALNRDEERLHLLRAEAAKGFDQLDAGKGIGVSPEDALSRSDRRLRAIQ